MLQVKSIAHNQTEIERDNGTIIFYSYETPVAVFVPGNGALCTTYKYSVTTSRHINKAVERWCCEDCRTDVEQSVIDEYAKE